MNRVFEGDGLTILGYAVEKGIQMMTLLLAHPKIDVNAGDMTALMFAAGLDYQEELRMLLDRPEIDVNRTSLHGDGDTALMHAAFSGCTSSITQLLNREEIEVNKTDNKGKTAFITAAEKGRIEAVTQFLARPDVLLNHADNDGLTALMWSAKNGHADVMKLMLDRFDITKTHETLRHAVDALRVFRCSSIPEIEEITEIWTDIGWRMGGHLNNDRLEAIENCVRGMEEAIDKLIGLLSVEELTASLQQNTPFQEQIQARLRPLLTAQIKDELLEVAWADPRRVMDEDDLKRWQMTSD